MNALLGASPKTSIIGYVIGALIVALEVLQEGGIPNSKQGWINYGVALSSVLIGRFAQDAPKPTSAPQS